MESLNERVLEAVSYIRTRVSCDPDIGIILGSGLGDLAYKIIDPVEISYADIPYFKSSTVAGHEGKLIFGKIYGKDVVAMKGRLHYYEGYSCKEIAEIIGIGESAVKMRLKKGREILRKSMEA